MCITGTDCSLLFQRVLLFTPQRVSQKKRHSFSRVESMPRIIVRVSLMIKIQEKYWLHVNANTNRDRQFRKSLFIAKTLWLKQLYEREKFRKNEHFMWMPRQTEADSFEILSSVHRQNAVIDTTVWKRKSSYANLSKVTKRCWELYLYLGATNYQFVSYISRDQETQPSKKSGSLASALYSMMWFYQLSWQCKWAILESFWSWCFECQLWRRANARNVRFTNSSSWPIYFVNSVDETKFSCISFTYVWSTTVSLETYHSFIHKVWLG